METIQVQLALQAYILQILTSTVNISRMQPHLDFLSGTNSTIYIGQVLIAPFNDCVLVKPGQIANPIIVMNDPIPYCSIRARLCLQSINFET